MTTRLKLLVPVLALVLSAPVLAGTATPRVDQRQAHQERRIDQGIASGSLTRREAVKLDAGQNRVDRLENRAKADGQVTRAERFGLHQVQNTQSRRIYRQKHDRQVR